MRALAVSLLLVLLPSPGCERPAPTSPWTSQIHDFGEVDEGAGTVAHVFRLENPGDEELLVTAAQPTCRCLVSVDAPFSVPPRSSHDVEVKMRLRGRAGPQRVGVRLHSRRFPNGWIDLELRGQVDAALLVTPRVLDVGRLHPGTEARGEVSVRARGAPGTLRLEPVAHLVRASARRTSRPDGGVAWTVTCETTARRTKGEFDRFVRIVHERPDGREEATWLRVHGEVGP